MAATYTAVMCELSNGQSRIFAADSDDSTTVYVELTDVITGNGIGDSAQGTSVVRVMATCENFVYSPGIVFVDNQNNVIQAVGANSPEQAQPQYQDVQIPIELNYKVKVLTQPSVA